MRKGKRGGGRFLKAESKAAASGVYKDLSVDLLEVSGPEGGRWRVDGVVEGGEAGTKSGDDYAARVYVTFAFEPERLTLFWKG